MKTRNRNILIAFSVLFTLLVIALFSMHSSFNDLSVMVDGDQVTGIPAAGYAFGGAIVGLVAAFLALVLVSLILTGVSIFVMLLLAAVFIVVVLALSPLLLPLLLVIGLALLFNRKKAVQIKQIN
jgi:hypothetical protein